MNNMTLDAWYSVFFICAAIAHRNKSALRRLFKGVNS